MEGLSLGSSVVVVVVKLVGVGSVINGATPSSFRRCSMTKFLITHI